MVQVEAGLCQQTRALSKAPCKCMAQALRFDNQICSEKLIKTRWEKLEK